MHFRLNRIPRPPFVPDPKKVSHTLVSIEIGFLRSAL